MSDFPFPGLMHFIREAGCHWLLPWWQFRYEVMDYTASPDWYAGAV